MNRKSFTYNPYNTDNPVKPVNQKCGGTPQNVERCYATLDVAQSTKGPRAAQKCPLQPEGTWLHGFYTNYWLPRIPRGSDIEPVQLGQLPHSAVKNPYPHPTLMGLMCLMLRHMQADFPAFTFYSPKSQALGAIVPYNTHPPCTIRVFVRADFINALKGQCGNRFFVKCWTNENHEIITDDRSPDFPCQHRVTDGPLWCVTIEVPKKFQEVPKKFQGPPPPVGGAAELY